MTIPAGIRAPGFVSPLMDVSSAELWGTAFGFFNLASGIAMLLASALAGWLWDALGAS